MCIHDLHLHIPRTSQKAWIKWARALPEGKSFFLAVLESWESCIGENRTRLLEMATAFLPQGQDEFETTADDVERAQHMLISLREVVKKTGESCIQRLRRFRRYNRIPALSDLRDLEVLLYANSKIHFVWKDVDDHDKQIDFILCVPPDALLTDPNDKRFLRFTTTGISLVNQSGEVFVGRGYQTVTWPIARLMNQSHAEQFRKMFNYQLGLESLSTMDPPDTTNSTLVSRDSKTSRLETQVSPLFHLSEC
jgi:hypothetical protein